MTPGQRLRALRIAADQSLADVQRGTRIHSALLNTLEAGRPMMPAHAYVLAKHFGVAVDDILGTVSTDA